jgi:hypothetical protein
MSTRGWLPVDSNGRIQIFDTSDHGIQKIAVMEQPDAAIFAP